MRLALALLLLAAPALAQQRTPEEIQAQIQACTEGVDVPAVTARAEAWATDAGYEAKVAALCEAGNATEAVAFAEQTQDAYYAQDPEAAKLRACLEGALGDGALSPGDVCGE